MCAQGRCATRLRYAPTFAGFFILDHSLPLSQNRPANEFPRLGIMCPSVRPIGRAMREPRMDPQSIGFLEQLCRP